MSANFAFKNKLLILRLNRLTHIPPAKQGAEILLERGVPLTVFEYGGDYPSSSSSLDGMPTVRLGTSWVRSIPRKFQAGFSFFHAFLYLIRKVRRDRPRFILTHGLQEQWLAYFLNRLFKIPYACHVHEVYERGDLRRLNHLLLEGEGRTLRRAHFTVFSSEDRARIYRNRYRVRTEFFTVFNAPRLRTPRPLSDFYKRQGVPEGKKVLLYIGGIGPLNASAEILESVKFLHERFVVVFVGWGDEAFINRLKIRAVELGVSECVKFVPPVSNKWEWIDNADGGFCLYQGVDLRSRYNAGPSNKLFEFISAGKPVIANLAEDFVRLVSGHELGINVDAKDPRLMAEEIEKLFNDELKIKRIEKNGKALHESHFNYETQFETVLERLLVDVIATDTHIAA